MNQSRHLKVRVEPFEAIAAEIHVARQQTARIDPQEVDCRRTEDYEEGRHFNQQCSGRFLL